ncbi:hypothetical protein GCM10028793_22690 [Nocardiopsis oceani]
MRARTAASARANALKSGLERGMPMGLLSLGCDGARCPPNTARFRGSGGRDRVGDPPFIAEGPNTPGADGRADRAGTCPEPDMPREGVLRHVRDRSL